MRLRCWLTAALVLSVVTPTVALADWIVYLGGGIQEVKGALEVRGRQVLFHSPSGTLLSVRAEDVDLPASAFLSWQVGERLRRPAAGAAPSKAQPAPAAPCVQNRVVEVVSAETLRLGSAQRAETVHLGCVDAPDTRHKFPQLAWYGHAATSEVEILARAGANVCVAEDVPPQRDVQGHRIVYARLASGADLGAEVIARGLGLAQRGRCGRAESSYRELERRAQIEERGLWGPAANDASLSIVTQALALHGGPAPQRLRVGGT